MESQSLGLDSLALKFVWEPMQDPSARPPGPIAGQLVLLVPIQTFRTLILFSSFAN